MVTFGNAPRSNFEELLQERAKMREALQAVWNSNRLNKTMLLGDVDLAPDGKVTGKYLDPLTQQISELLNTL
jgi:hypothetical protein